MTSLRTPDADYQREFHLRQRRCSFTAILESIGENELAQEAAQGRFDPEPREGAGK